MGCARVCGGWGGTKHRAHEVCDREREGRTRDIANERASERTNERTNERANEQTRDVAPTHKCTMTFTSLNIACMVWRPSPPPTEPETLSIMVSEGAQACRRQTSRAGRRTPGARRRGMTNGCSTVAHSRDNSHRRQTTDTRPTRQPCIPGRMRAGTQALTPRGATLVLVCGGGAGCPQVPAPPPARRRPPAPMAAPGSTTDVSLADACVGQFWHTLLGFVGRHGRRFVGRRLIWAHPTGFLWQTVDVAN